MDEWRTCTANDVQSIERDVLAKRVSDEIDGVAQLEQRPNPVKLAEGGAPRLEKRLRGQHQNVHATTAIVGNGSRNVKPKSPPSYGLSSSCGRFRAIIRLPSVDRYLPASLPRQDRSRHPPGHR